MSVTMRPSQLRPTPHSCVSGSHLLANTIKLSISSAKPSLFRSEPCNAPRSSVLTPVFSHSCELFCASRKVKSFTIYNIRTLSPKHPGVGYPPPYFRLSHCDVSLCPAGYTSFSLRHRTPRAGRRYNPFGLPAPYWLKHLRARSAGTSRKSSGAEIAVTFHAAACVVAFRRLPRECRKIDSFQGSHAK
jgi:hypothetical protein